MKKILKETLKIFIIILASILVFLDRLICSILVFKDMPSIYEIKKFKHEREAMSRRYIVYLIILLVFVLVKFIKHLIIK